MRLLPVVCALAFGACRDDFEAPAPTEVVEGLPATVILSLAVGDMVSPDMTRSFIDENAANFCQDVWIGIFRKSDGRCTYKHLITDPADVNENTNQKYGLGRFSLPAESGESYIVAIANSTTRYGIASTSKDPVHDKVLLSQLLDSCQTWKQFRDIVVLRSDTAEITVNSPDLCMSGYYTEDDANYKSTEDDDIPTYNINPGENALTGKLYLRRLMSYSKFYVHSGPNVNLEISSWRVCNNAACCYLFEQTTVAADPLDWYGTSTDMHSVTSEGSGVFSFEAYLYANRESACDYAKLADGDYVGIRPDATPAEQYADRERRFAKRGPKGQLLFKSLVANPDAEGLEAFYPNTATYVEITARVTYYIADNEANRANPEAALPEAYDASKKQIFREGRTTYTVHLGYCHGKDSLGNPTYETACDFNVRRNHRYIYNIYINGLRNVVLDARTGDENQPGATGYVTDAYDSNILLDAHYGAFNISLSNVDRMGMGYHIMSPFDGSLAEFTQDSPASATTGNEFFEWIRFKPTTSKDVLAVYHDGTFSNDLWTLRELADPIHHPHSSGRADSTDLTAQWYTVFVDEYVYHQDLAGNRPESGVETLWPYYVNQDNRVCEMVISNKSHKGDSNSSYTSSKYVVSQRSIQTYYRLGDDGTGNGVGVEHTNESYGLNMRWFSIGYTGLNAYDGRMNAVRACLVAAGANGQWAKAVNFKASTEVPADTNSATFIGHAAASYPVPALVGVSSSHYAGDPSPNDNHYYYASLACMNRNRDLNGDGKITADEVRWYLPSYWGYVRIMAGQTELNSPLMDWDKYPTNFFASRAGILQVNGRQDFHFVTSDGRYLWAEEGMSVGDGLYGSKEGYPYQMRCVRNLGTSLKSYSTAYNANDASETTPPYIVRGNIIELPYYVDRCIRSWTGSYLIAHPINSLTNRTASAFEVSADYCKGIKDEYGYVYVDEDGYLYGESTKPSKDQEWIEVWTLSLLRNTLCGKYTQSADRSDLGAWRVPNQSELTFMQMCGFITSGDNVVCGTHEYFDSYSTDDYRHKFFGISKGIMTRALFEYQLSGQKVKVRCVRDVQ